METRFIQNDVEVTIIYSSPNDAEVTPDEVQAYIDRSSDFKSEGKMPKGAKLAALTLNVEGDDVDISYQYAMMNFERIRRITGYLVGNLDRFNNAKRAEVEDRVKHTIADDCEDVYVDAKPKKKSKGMEIGD